MKNIIYYSLMLFLIAACNQNKSTNQAFTENNETQIADAKINKVYSSYILLKNELVNSDSVKSKELATQLSKDLAEVEGCDITSKYADSLSIANDLKAQRNAFSIISSDIIALMQRADIKSGSVYVQFCPMASDGNGAYWLANQKEIRNPYYGDEMLECGEVKKEFTKK